MGRVSTWMGDRLGIRGAVFILPLQAKTVVKKADEPVSCSYYPILDSLVVRIPACHAGGRGSIPRQGENFFPCQQKRVLLKF